MKKQSFINSLILYFIVIFSLFFTLASCGNGVTEQNNSENHTVYQQQVDEDPDQRFHERCGYLHLRFYLFFSQIFTDSGLSDLPKQQRLR